MPRYRFAGLDPLPDGKGGIVRPGEIRDEGDLPDFGPWEPVDAPEPPVEAAPDPAPAKGAASKTEPSSDDSATE